LIDLKSDPDVRLEATTTVRGTTSSREDLTTSSASRIAESACGPTAILVVEELSVGKLFVVEVAKCLIWTLDFDPGAKIEQRGHIAQGTNGRRPNTIPIDIGRLELLKRLLSCRGIGCSGTFSLSWRLGGIG
jgi:hypothetical protein